MRKKTISPVGHSWEEVRKELFTPEELAASDLRVAELEELIKRSNETEINQINGAISVSENKQYNLR